jgi:hypothetical protein
MLCRQRHRIEIIFGRLKDWRRIAMRYDRCAHTFPRWARPVEPEEPPPSRLFHLHSEAGV